MLRLLVVLVAIAMVTREQLVACKVHKYCCTPRKWESSMWGVGGTELPGERSARVWMTGLVGFDGTSQQRYYYENRTTGSVVTSQKYIEDFKTGSRYVIDLLNHTCVKSQIEEPFNGCLPDDAVHLYRDYYGMNNDTVYVNIYKLRLVSPVRALDDYVIVSDRDCICLSESVAGTDNNATMFLTMNFFGTTAGISDPSVFDIPNICRQNATTSYPVGPHYSPYGYLYLTYRKN